MVRKIERNDDKLFFNYRERDREHESPFHHSFDLNNHKLSQRNFYFCHEINHLLSENTSSLLFSTNLHPKIEVKWFSKLIEFFDRWPFCSQFFCVSDIENISTSTEIKDSYLFHFIIFISETILLSQYFQYTFTD